MERKNYLNLTEDFSNEVIGPKELATVIGNMDYKALSMFFQELQLKFFKDSKKYNKRNEAIISDLIYNAGYEIAYVKKNIDDICRVLKDNSITKNNNRKKII